MASELGDFSDQAASYERARPGYPEALVDRLLARLSLGAGERVADLGAGTGIFSRLLAARGFSVTAVEPNREMRSRATGAEASVDWREGTFESTGISAASQRWVVAAQAFHWATPALALPEVRRILVAGGHFTVLWNNRDNPRSPILTETVEALRRCVPEYDHDYRRCDWAELLCSTGDFARVETDEERHLVALSAAAYRDLWRSNNRIAHFAGERMSALLEEVDAILARRSSTSVEIPYVCRAWTVRRV